MTDIRVLSQKTVVSTHLLEVKKEKVVFGKNNKVEHCNAYRRPASLVIPMTESYEIFLVSQYRYMIGKKVLGAIGGYKEDGETFLETAKRELEEEAGFSANNWEQILKVDLAASVVQGTLHIFLARGLEEVAHKREIGEEIEVVKIPLEEASQKAVQGEIGDATSLAGILIVDKLRRERKI